MASATIGALEFHFVAMGTANPPDLPRGSRLGSAELDVEVHWEDGQAFLVIDHRRNGDGDGPARVELWRPSAQPEMRLGYLVVLADRRPGEAGAPSGHESSLTALVDSLLAA